MRFNRRQLVKIASVIGCAGLVVVFLGNGCSQEFTTISSQLAAPSVGLAGSSGDAGGGSTGITVIPGAKTASLVYANEVLNHMSACAGVAKPSDATQQMYDAKKGAISVYGAADTITSPMMMAVTSIAGEVCNDLIDQEIKLGARMFNGIDMNSTSVPANGALADIVTKMALSCWQRYETSTERQKIIDMVMTSVSSGESMASRKSSLMICTSMLSSLDALLN